ncbi:MAG TPA: redoxin domain-containing protein [Candidatus Deferrimicrobium sp.]|nr:redoxin domain-containing protein [Candidatus Deferrimicrobium sp.]
MKDKFSMINTKIPDFSLQNTRGDRVNIYNFNGKKIVVLVLLRGLMDLFCQGQVFRLAKDIEKFRELNTELYVITADRFENARRLELQYAKEKFPVYFDKTHEVVRLLKQEVKVLRLGRLPAILIIDKQSIIRWAYYGDALHDIPSNKTIFEELEKLSN